MADDGKANDLAPATPNHGLEGRRVDGPGDGSPFAFGKAPANRSPKESPNQAAGTDLNGAVSVPGNAAAPGVETQFPGHAPVTPLGQVVMR